MKLQDDRWCFACGADNPHGLHLADFHFEGDKYVFTFTQQKHHQGWADLTHGGIVATLLDEAMTRMLWESDTDAVTAQITIRYRQPLPVGQPVIVRAWVTERRGPLIQSEAEVVLSDETLVASATAQLMATSD